MSATATVTAITSPDPALVLTGLIDSLRGRHHLRVVTDAGQVIVGRLLAAKPTDGSDLLRLRCVDSGNEHTIDLHDVTHAMWTDHVPF